MLKLLKKEKNAFYYISVLIIDRITGLILVYFLVRNLSDENFSFWTQVHFLPGAVCGILLLGFGQGILRIFVESKFSQKVVTLMIFSISFVYLLICLFAYFLILKINNININNFLGGQSNISLGILIISIFIILEGFYEILLNFLRAKIYKSFILFTFLRIIPRIIAALFIIVFNFDFWISIYLYLFGSTIIIISLFFFVLKAIKINHPKEKFNAMNFYYLYRKLVQFSIPVMISALSLPLLNIILRDYVIKVSGYDQLGVLAIYMSFIGMIIYFPESYQSYIYPKLTSLKNKSRNYILNNCKYGIIFAGFLCLVFVFINPYLLNIFYPKKIWTGIDGLFISITAFFWVFYFSIQRLYLIYFSNKTILLSIISFVSFVSAFILLYAELISGPLNAVLGLMTFFLVSLLIIIFFLRNFFINKK
jgi:PST family polysaccharide transporter